MPLIRARGGGRIGWVGVNWRCLLRNRCGFQTHSIPRTKVYLCRVSMDIDKLISVATGNIAKNYFQLPVDGRDDPIYRERVYCYELYHQLRLYWPTNTQYEIGGEVDKSGHPFVRGGNLNSVKPDFLIHVPGNMGDNYAVVEVKPIIASRSGVAKDLATLTGFCRCADYSRAIYLFYGGGDIHTVIDMVNSLQDDDEKGRFDLSLIEFWWHREVGVPANKFQVLTGQVLVL